MVVLGLMSGSSLDGIDAGLFKFTVESSIGFPRIDWLQTRSFDYPTTLKDQLKVSDQLSLSSYFELEAAVSRFYGQIVNSIKEQFQVPDLVAVHGHTVLHNPNKGFSIQMGLGGVIAEIGGVPVVLDFRNNAIAHGWQGAPMAGLLDKLYSSQYSMFLNLGGISNLSLFLRKTSISFDVCGCNQVLNYLAAEVGKQFDEDGSLASTGKVLPELLQQLNEFPALKRQPPRSLSNQEVRSFYDNVLENHQGLPQDRMRTVVEHIADSIITELENYADLQEKQMMVTGGGAHHKNLIEILSNKLKALKIELIVPDRASVDFKESLLIAYAAWLRWQEQMNFIPESEQAGLKVSGGGVYLPANYH